eukprot:14900640-Alexandrium_andersonii.AAC.1
MNLRGAARPPTPAWWSPCCCGTGPLRRRLDRAPRHPAWSLTLGDCTHPGGCRPLLALPLPLALPDSPSGPPCE